MKKQLIIFALLFILTDYCYAQFKVVRFPNLPTYFANIKPALDSSVWLNFGASNYNNINTVLTSKNDSIWSSIQLRNALNWVDFSPISLNKAFSISPDGDAADSSINYIYKFSSSAMLDSTTIKADIDLGEFFDYIHFFNNNDGVILSDGSPMVVYTTNNGGTSWTKVQAANLPATTFCAFLAAIDNRISAYKDTMWTLPIYFNLENSVTNILKTTNKGQSWQRIVIPTTLFPHVQISIGNFASCISFKNGKEGIYSVVDSNNNVILLKTTDGGNNWETINYSGIPTGKFNLQNEPYLYYSSTGNVYLANSNRADGLYVSTDNGLNWSKNASLSGTQLGSIKESNGKIYINGLFDKRLYISTEQQVLLQNPYVVSATNIDSNVVDVTMSDIMDPTTSSDTSNFTVQYRTVLHLRQSQGSQGSLLRDSTIWTTLKLKSSKRNPIASNRILITTEQILPIDSIKVFTRDVKDKNGFSVIANDSLAKTIFQVKDCRTATVPKIVIQPQNKQVCPSDSVRLVFTAQGNIATILWQKNGIAIPAQNDYSIKINTVSVADTGSYRVIVHSFCHYDTSILARISLFKPINITQQPQPQSKATGDSVRFTTLTTGSNLSYQWQKNGVNISGQINYTYKINAVAATDTGFYKVVVTNPCGQIVSDSAKLRLTDLLSIKQNNSTNNTIKSIFPNPSNNEINIVIQSKQASEIELRIIDLNGTEIYTNKIQSVKGELNKKINVSQFAKGMYIIQIQDKEGISSTKFLVE